MIPFGLLSGFMDGKEIRIIELAEEGFRFRLSEKAASPESFLVCFYDMEQASYHEIEVRNYTIEEDNASSELAEFCTEYTVFVNNESYRHEVRKLQGQYSRYIRLKLEDDDEELTRVLTGYPEKKPVDYYNLEIRQSYSLETAIEIDRPELYREYLQNDIKQLIEQCYEWRRITGNQSGSDKQNDSPESALNIGYSLNLNRIYIGNQFCHLLFPDEKELFMMLEKAHKESLGITIAFSYIREFMLKSIEKLIKRLAQWCREKDTCIEIVINDWAMADIIARQNAESAIKKSKDINEMRQYLIPCLGILLNKRKKDPRFPYKKGNKSLYSQNNLNEDFYRKYLRSEFEIQRYEWESCGYEQEFPQGKNSLHLPYYQTNTSQYCPLHAICTTGNRGMQQLVKECPHYCSTYTLTYPKHLNMTGRFNSLFGIDKELLNHLEKIKAYANAGIDRLVIGWE